MENEIKETKKRASRGLQEDSWVDTSLEIAGFISKNILAGACAAIGGVVIARTFSNSPQVESNVTPLRKVG